MTNFAGFCASHSPLTHTWPDIDPDFFSVMTRAGEWIDEYGPDLVIQFSPDHFNGLFYDAMPSFCIAAGAESVGDWHTPLGVLDVPGKTAGDLALAVREEDIDVAFSYRLPVDHGTTQVWSMVNDGLPKYPTIPIVINCAAPPRPTMRRCRQLGEAVGRFAEKLGKRVLFVASGGLSHDPPIPQYEKTEGPIRELLLAGRNLSQEETDAREGRVIAGAQSLVAREGKFMDPDPEWDARVLELCSAGDITAFDDWDDEQISSVGGSGGHEIRCWIAALAALKTAGGAYDLTIDHYKVALDWMTGMGVARAEAR